VNVSSKELCILTLIASGVSADEHGLRSRLGTNALEVADYLMNSGKACSDEVVSLGLGLQQGVAKEKRYPILSERPDAGYEAFVALESQHLARARPPVFHPPLG
jgi:hypothetical protein